MTKYFDTPFADSGDKTPIPNTVQPGGQVSYPEGYGVDYQLEQGVNPAAKDIPRDAENQIKFDITEALKEIQETGTLPYRADINYLVKARTIGSDNIDYACLIPNGPATSVVDPVGDVSGTWIAAAGGISPGDPSVSVSADDTTLGNLEDKIVAGANIILATLNPGANETLEISAAGGGIVADSLLQTGYIQFENGLIVQWGKTGNLNANACVNQALPITFPTSAWISVATPRRNTSSSSAGGNTSTVTTTTVTVCSLGTANAYSAGANWIAIGR